MLLAGSTELSTVKKLMASSFEHPSSGTLTFSARSAAQRPTIEHVREYIQMAGKHLRMGRPLGAIVQSQQDVTAVYKAFGRFCKVNLQHYIWHH